ncbi:MAG TPA: nucleotide exchange factor GrpE [Actinocrinis sp.]|uniref:nucleotide exchange factor GrpE n=1 Tax=Actinocrinis sp. TaxID=1920516 RepID=UPI002DDCB409|nr:nucleotide exchange factor GrpE [Actinocrinis sp.]HEV3173275.1 nucleotide exchange factor GrpE [Actinocrinis sp.]
MSDDLYHPGQEAGDDARVYGDDEGFEAAKDSAGQNSDGEQFAERVNEAIGGDPGDPTANLAVAELLAKLAERTNDLQGAQAELNERTADLQRLQAEYVNYRRRVERDRVAMAELSLGKVLGELLPVLDDIGRARDHGELEGGFRRVAESLESTVAKLGLEQFGTVGELFDPNVHEALMHREAPEIEEDTVVEILQPGYRLGDRVLRVARVTVAQPGDGVEQ